MAHFRSGVVGLDREHDYLIALASRLTNEALDSSRSARQLQSLVAHLQHFTHRHFATEEQLMEAYEFPAREEHCAEHERMKAWVEAFVLQAQKGTLALPMLRGFLQGWIAAHMATRDRELALHLAKVRESVMSA